MKRLLLGLVIACLMPVAAWAASPYFIETPETITPGKVLLYTFFAPEDALCDLTLVDASGQMAAVVTQEHEAIHGANTLNWDGTYWGEQVAPGQYMLTLTVNEETITTPLTVLGEEAPTAEPVAEAAESTPSPALEQVAEVTPPPAAEPAGEPVAQAIELEALGLSTDVEEVEPEYAISPSYLSPYACQHENCYWSLPMDITDEEAVWNALMAPMTVVKGDEKEQVLLRAEPSEKSAAIAEITCYSQGVHVLENLDNGWSLVEIYSSSFIYSDIKAWNQFTQGYIKTDKLQERKVGNVEYGMVVDKLTQRLYVFKDGKLFTELLCSTGLGTDDSPYNETRSGEFFLVSAVGEFPSGKLYCSYGIRFNDGDILHEVPHLKRSSGKNYETTEYKLGNRASHGCIRIQRLKNQDGVNMKWLWNELYKTVKKKNVRLFIWEDYKGRQLEIPAEDTLLYYNPNGGTSYHAVENCVGVRDKFLPLTAFTYGELETETFANLTPCGHCGPVKRLAQIQAINAALAN